MIKIVLASIFLFVFLSQAVCAQQEKIKFADTKEIKLLIFGKEYDGTIFKPHDIMQLHITLVLNTNNIEYLEVTDQFADNCLCIGVGTKCPKLIAKFNFKEKFIINKLSFRMRFPCKSVYLKQMSISLTVKLKTYNDEYFKRKYNIPIGDQTGKSLPGKWTYDKTDPSKPMIEIK